MDSKKKSLKKKILYDNIIVYSEDGKKNKHVIKLKSLLSKKRYVVFREIGIKEVCN